MASKLTFGTGIADWQERINVERMRRERPGKARQVMKKHGGAAILPAGAPHPPFPPGPARGGVPPPPLVRSLLGGARPGRLPTRRLVSQLSPGSSLDQTLAACAQLGDRGLRPRSDGKGGGATCRRDLSGTGGAQTSGREAGRRGLRSNRQPGAYGEGTKDRQRMAPDARSHENQNGR